MHGHESFSLGVGVGIGVGVGEIQMGDRNFGRTLEANFALAYPCPYPDPSFYYPHPYPCPYP